MSENPCTQCGGSGQVSGPDPAWPDPCPHCAGRGVEPQDTVEMDAGEFEWDL